MSAYDEFLKEIIQARDDQLAAKSKITASVDKAVGIRQFMKATSPLAEIEHQLNTCGRSMAGIRLDQQRAQCGRTPSQCPINRMTVAGSPLFRSLTSIMNERVVGHLYTRKDSGKLRVRIESVEIVDTIHATVHTCIFDSVVLFDSGQIYSAADDIVFDDSVISAFMVWSVQLDHGIWKWVSSTATQRKIGADICGFAN